MKQNEYRQIYNDWLVKDLETNKTAIIYAHHFVTWLHFFQVISEFELETVNYEKNNSDRNRKLFLEIMPAKGEVGLQKIIEIMKNSHDDEILGYLNHVMGLGIKIVPDKIWGDAPKRNLCFINRQSVKENVQAIFQKQLVNNNSVAVAIFGFGGVGKTQAVADFLYENEDNYKQVFWIQAENVEAEFTRIDEAFKLHIKEDQNLVKMLKTWFAQHCSPCLLIFDDATCFKQIENYLPRKGCHILITSRNSNWPLNEIDKCISLDVFSVEEAKCFVTKMLENKTTTEDADVFELSSMLGHLPLALSHACAYISECCWQISDYIKDLERQLKLNTPIENSPVLPAVFATWSITHTAIKDKSTLADKLLCVCSFLQPDAIPTFLLKDAAGQLQLKEEGNNEFSKAMRILMNFSMLTWNTSQNCVSIHCLLQTAIRYRNRSDEKTRLVEVAGYLILSYPSERNTFHLNRKRQLLPHLSLMSKSLDVLAWPVSQFDDDQVKPGLIMQLLECNADGNREIGIRNEEATLLVKLLSIKVHRFGTDSPDVAETYLSLGNAQHSLGDYKQAKELLEKALLIFEEQCGKDHPKVAETLVHMATNCDSFGDYAKAKDLLERALVIKELHFGSSHLQLASCLYSLGKAYDQLFDHNRAKELLQNALDIQEKYLGSDHPDVATSLNRLGVVYGWLGNSKRHKELLERALAIDEGHFGADHPKVAVTLTNLAIGLGVAKQQKDLLERALTINEGHFGFDHPIVATTLYNLGCANNSLGDAKKAKELFERVLVIQEEHFAPDHPKVVTALGSLGTAYMSLGDTKKAKELFERVLLIQEEQLGPGHPQVAVTLGNLGAAYMSLGDTKKAKELFERALVIQEEHFGPDHPEVARSLGSLGCIYGLLLNPKKEKDFLERAQLIVEEHYGPNHTKMAEILTSLGSAYDKLGDPQGAICLLEKSLEIKASNFGPEDPRVATTLTNLAIAHISLGECNEAIKLLKRALTIRETHFGLVHPTVSATLSPLGNAFASIGDYKQAEELLLRAFQINEQCFDSDNREKLHTLVDLAKVHALLGDREQALTIYQKAYRIMLIHFGEDHPNTVLCKQLLDETDKEEDVVNVENIQNKITESRICCCSIS